jgi:hypothetical protein
MLKKFKMEDYKPTSTPMITGSKLSKDDESNGSKPKIVQIYDWKLIICDILKTRCHAGSWSCCRFQSMHQRKLMYRQLRYFSGI